MQVLRACRAALQAPAAAGGDGPASGPAVHCFEVTPLGPRLGLVQVRPGVCALALGAAS